MPFQKDGKRNYKKWDEQGRVCTACQTYKLWDDFSWKRSAREKGKPEIHKQKQPKCKICAAKDTRRWVTDNKDTAKERYLQRTYGIGEKEYQAMLLSQNNCCVLCGTEFVSGGWGPDSPVVDHCHTQGHVRGILCNECNRGLGYFHDNPIALQRAAQYLTGNMNLREGAAHAFYEER